jgi:hypothetical protein
MTVRQTETFGEIVVVRRLGPLAQSVASHINGGRAMTWAGFVWNRSETASRLGASEEPAAALRAA